MYISLTLKQQSFKEHYSCNRINKLKNYNFSSLFFIFYLLTKTVQQNLENWDEPLQQQGRQSLLDSFMTCPGQLYAQSPYFFSADIHVRLISLAGRVHVE